MAQPTSSRAQVMTSFRPESAREPQPYTGSPLKLLWEDTLLCLHLWKSIPGILLPILPFRSGPLDELYPTPRNLANIALHTVLVIVQLLFLLILIVLPATVVVPLGPSLAFIGIFWLCNRGICYLLNFDTDVLESKTDLTGYPDHDDEYWIFLNGVAVGRNWLQANIDLLSLTFRRPITGIHNPTSGIIFDILQCLLQRCFSYATTDVRNAHTHLKIALQNPHYKKVVFICHSQGGIEGALIVDWLLAELPQDLLANLEVYTFGNAANHFNSPLRSTPPQQQQQQQQDPNKKTQKPSDPPASEPSTPARGPPAPPNPAASPSAPRVIPHIEHYANSRDFVARWGVLQFACAEDRYIGRVFVRAGSGHLMDLHYLDVMFSRRLAEAGGPGDQGGVEVQVGEVMEGNGFMDLEVEALACGGGGGSDGSSGSSGSSSGARAGSARELVDGAPGAEVGGLAELLHAWVGELGREKKMKGGIVGGLAAGSGRANGVRRPGDAAAKLRVKDVSRLWEYRNGRVPVDVEKK